MVGRKCVVLVDADGVWLAVATVPASVQERDTLPALDAGSAHWPSLRLAIFDGGFTADRCREWANFHGMRHHVVSREPGQKGFVVLPRRWVVERSFGWLAHGAACCATAPDSWMSQPGVSPSSPFCLVFRHCSIQCQSVPLDYENPTQTGSEGLDRLLQCSAAAFGAGRADTR